MYRAVGDGEEADILRVYLRRLSEWSEDWQMRLNLEKCFQFSYETGWN